MINRKAAFKYAKTNSGNHRTLQKTSPKCLRKWILRLLLFVMSTLYISLTLLKHLIRLLITFDYYSSFIEISFHQIYDY